MPAHESSHDDDAERPRRAAAFRPAANGAPPGALTPGSPVRLQRTAGNTVAVSGLTEHRKKQQDLDAGTINGIHTPWTGRTTNSPRPISPTAGSLLIPTPSRDHRGSI